MEIMTENHFTVCSNLNCKNNIKKLKSNVKMYGLEKVPVSIVFKLNDHHYQICQMVSDEDPAASDILKIKI